MADLRKYAQLQSFQLAGSGAVLGATTLVLTSFKDIDGNNLAMSDFGTKGFGTIEPSSGEFEESISWTGVIQNANGTATLTGVSNVAFLYPYTETSGLGKSHAGGVTFIVTNTSAFYDGFTNKNDDETIVGTWSFTAVPNSTSAPISGDDLTNKTYVDNLVNGGTISVNKIVVAGTAGETVAAGTPVYLKASDGRWWKAIGTTASTLNSVELGIAQGSGTAGVAIANGVLLRGLDSNQSGGSVGAVGYISDTSTIATSAGTVSKAIGNFITTTTFNFDPYQASTPSDSEKAALAGTYGTPSPTNKYATQTTYIATMTAGATITGATTPVPVYQDATSFKVLACDANDTAAMKFIGFAITSSTDTNPINVQTSGIVGGFTGLTRGIPYYVSDTVGTISATVGSSEIMVGWAISTTEILIQKGRRWAAGVINPIGSSTTSVPIVCGFKPSRITLTGFNGSTTNLNGFYGTWLAGSSTTLANNSATFYYNEGTQGGVDNGAQLMNTDNLNRMTFTVDTVTSTGFTVTYTETGTYTAAGIVAWTAEGDI